jgi:hypothetical protein
MRLVAKLKFKTFGRFAMNAMRGKGKNLYNGLGAVLGGETGHRLRSTGKTSPNLGLFGAENLDF